MDPTASNDLRAATDVLAKGGVVCFPTESSYGLAARLDRPEACARIAAIKQRDPGSPFPVIADSLAAAQGLSRDWPKAATDLAARHWPGPLTLVIEADPRLPAEVIGPTGGVGVRVSSHELARALAALAGPLTATSANRRGQPPATTAADAISAFADDDIHVLDGGACRGGPPSTVVAVASDGALTVIRQGAIELSKMV